MQIGAITSSIDVAQLVLYAFWLFFAGLIFYLRQEDKREGYPLVNDRSDRVVVQGFPPIPAPKTFLLAHGATRIAPRREVPVALNAVAVGGWPGAPLTPIGNPMLDGLGPAAYAHRADEPDRTFDDNMPKVVPLRAAPGFFLAWEDPDPRGMTVLGADRTVAGTVVDAWVDRSEVVIRYLEVELARPGATARVLVPMNFLMIRRKQRQIGVSAITAAQFADVPALRNPDIVTLLEEDRITAYFAGGLLYALPGRLESRL